MVSGCFPSPPELQPLLLALHPSRHPMGGNPRAASWNSTTTPPELLHQSGPLNQLEGRHRGVPGRRTGIAAHGNPDVTIGLIDGPVAIAHPDLAGARIREVPG